MALHKSKHRWRIDVIHSSQHRWHPKSTTSMEKGSSRTSRLMPPPKIVAMVPMPPKPNNNAQGVKKENTSDIKRYWYCSTIPPTVLLSWDSPVTNYRLCMLQDIGIVQPYLPSHCTVDLGFSSDIEGY